MKELCDLVKAYDNVISADIVLNDEHWYLPRIKLATGSVLTGRPTLDLGCAISEIKIAGYNTAKSGSYEISINIAIQVKWPEKLIERKGVW